LLETYAIFKEVVNAHDIVDNDPVFEKYESTYLKQDIEGDPLKKAFRETIERDDENYGEDPVPWNEEEAKWVRHYDEIRMKYFDLKFEWYYAKKFDNIWEEFLELKTLKD